MRYGMYVETGNPAVGRIYLVAESGYIVRLSSGQAGEDDIVLGVKGMSAMDAKQAEEADIAILLQSAEDADMAVLCRAAEEITRYFAGELTEFTVPVRTYGTDFQRKVWQALRQISYGQTQTYGEIARAVGSPNGARAVGMACNRNPVMLMVPCHRVVGEGGRMVGFACGIPMKQALLDLEKEALYQINRRQKQDK